MSNMGITNGRISLQEFAIVDGNVRTAARNEVGNGANAPSFGDRIKDAFANFGNKISEKFAAFKEKLGEMTEGIKAKFEALQQHMAERAEIRQQAKTERLDAADRLTAGREPKIDLDKPDNATLGKLAGNPDKLDASKRLAVLSSELSGILSQIETRASENDADAIALRRDVISEFIGLSSAIEYREADTRALSDMATTFARQGRTDKADFMRDLVNQIEDGRTPEGGRDRFKELAIGVSTQASAGGQTFMRATSNVNTAAVKKLMDAEGAGAIGNTIRTESLEMVKKPEVKQLEEQLQASDLKQMSNQSLSRDQAVKLGSLALKLLDMALAHAPTDGMKEGLGDITEAIQRDGGDKADSMTHQLFSDQLVLKMMSPALAKDSWSVRMAADFINVVANGVRDQSKWGTEARQVYAELGPVIHQKLEDYFTAAGMPESARTTW